MINICSIRDLKNYANCEQYAIVRSLKNPIKGVSQMPELSPDWNLFKFYLNEKNQGTWNVETFQNEYVPRFINQIKKDAQARKTLERLIKESHTKDIALACFCSNIDMCHRKIIAAILKKAGAAIGDII